MKQTKKQPINVQLSKDDLKELLTVLKNFIVKEIFVDFKKETFHRINYITQRVFELEKSQRSREPKRVLICPHKDLFDSIWYSETTDAALGLKYKCKWCGRELIKTSTFLSWREKRALRKLGVKI